MNSLNMTGANPFINNMMYGGNFVDILFRHLMEHGWKGVTFMAFVNFYMYLSLDRIKDFFKVANDKIGEYFKMALEKMNNNLKPIILSRAFILIDHIKNFISLFSRKKNDGVELIITEPKKCVVVTINHKNKLDLMALGNFILEHKNIIKLHNHQRVNSDKYKTTEIYDVPDLFVFEYQYIKEILDKDIELPNDLVLEITQNVNYKLSCETDDKVKILKDINIEVPEDTMETSWNTFIKIAKEKLGCPISDFPGFNSKVLSWSACPNAFYGGCSAILFYCYYTKNFNLFKTLINYTKRNTTFDFAGTKYTLKNVENVNPSKIDEKFNEFQDELGKYIDEKLIPYYCEEKTKLITTWIAEKKYLFDPVIKFVPTVTLKFTSGIIETNKLSALPRVFMKKIMVNYYNQSRDNIGNKISIYSLGIKYEIEKQKKENPKHKKWLDKYGETLNEEKEKAKNTTDDKKDEKSDDKKTEVSASNGTSATGVQSVAQNKSMSHPMIDNYDPYSMYSYGKYYGKNYCPREPEKYIYEENTVPVAVSTYIKSDKKPFKYLYLKGDDKDTLECYLNNYRNNRELYEELGIAYKGGIMLSGIAGCGKTSTIISIGTYLNKDIYYLDLGKIKTNHELKLCVDFIKTNSQKGGIIIFEDIDCMTDIVKSRESENSEPIKNASMSISETDVLSLSFLLNIIDGTMAPEDIIFIMTTNHVEKLDKALVRPGRIDIHIRTGKCDSDQLQKIYMDLYGKQLDTNLVNRFRSDEFIIAEVIIHLFHNIYNKNTTPEKILQKFLVPLN